VQVCRWSEKELDEPQPLESTQDPRLLFHAVADHKTLNEVKDPQKQNSPYCSNSQKLN